MDNMLLNILTLQYDLRNLDYSSTLAILDTVYKNYNNWATLNISIEYLKLNS